MRTPRFLARRQRIRAAEAIIPPDVSVPAWDQPPEIGEIAANWRQLVPLPSENRRQLTADVAEWDGWRVAAATMVGKHHLNHGVCRQDAYDFSLCDAGVVLAVADGPSAPVENGIAAEATVRAAVEYCQGHWRPDADDAECADVLMTAFVAVREAVAGLQAALSQQLDAQLETTLALVLVDSNSAGELRIRSATVGDSPIVVINASGALDVLGERPASFGNDPGPLLPDADCQLRTSTAAADSIVLATSDGFARDLMTRAEILDWTRSRLRATTTSVAAAHLLGYEVQGSFDDRTYVATWRSSTSAATEC